MRKRVVALFVGLLVSAVASTGIVTISAADDKSSTYHIMKRQRKIIL